jgi:GNAT superfamily N-acetyltransferase
MAGSFLVRDISSADQAQWTPLWQGYLDFYEMSGLSPEITENTWRRFLDPSEPVHALVAEADGKLLGLVHYVFHRNTWCLEDVCYLEDLFTAASARGRGVGRALIEAVYAKALERKASRVYWLTQESNKTAQALYDKVASRTEFIQYRKNF